MTLLRRVAAAAAAAAAAGRRRWAPEPSEAWRSCDYGAAWGQLAGRPAADGLGKGGTRRRGGSAWGTVGLAPAGVVRLLCCALRSFPAFFILEEKVVPYTLDKQPTMGEQTSW